MDLRYLRPYEVIQLLNSTPIGEVLTRSRLSRLRARAGLQIGDGRRIDLFRLIAWLVTATRKSTSGQPAEQTSYEQIKERARARQARIAKEGRDIGPLRAPADLDRRAAAGINFRVDCETYHRDIFYLPWSGDHLEVLAVMETVATAGGLFVLAMPRGSGKTSLCECLAEWTARNGHRRYVLLIGADRTHAISLIDSIKTDLLCNDLLAADWPEVCEPIRRMEGIANRCKGQLCDGQPTHLQWGRMKIVLPVIPSSPASGAVIEAIGLLGRIRGRKHTLPSGTVIRPDLVIIEDPQTDQSARKPEQCEKRAKIINGAILKAAGPDRRIAAIMPCTVIYPRDLADELVNPTLHPQWQGRRFGFFRTLPENEKLWAQYAEIVRGPGPYEQNLRKATAFYSEHRSAMDAGAEVGWPGRYEAGEISAVQHGMNVKLLDETAFWSEYQNRPIVEEPGHERQLTPQEITAKLSGFPRGVIPLRCSTLTGMIDVHDKLLYWVIVAWAEGFYGVVTDYGTFPEQRQSYYTLRDAAVSLHRRGVEKHAAILTGLETLIDKVMTREFRREDGQILHVARLLVDAGYVPDQVFQAIRTSRHAASVMPSMGLPIGARNKPFHEYVRHPGDRVGLYWRIPASRGKRLLPAVNIDTNYWKSRMRDRIRTAAGQPTGSLELFGRQAVPHRLYADHLCAEYSIRVEARGRAVEEWKLRPGNPDNHFLDCTVGAMVAASLSGIADPAGGIGHRPRRRVSLAELIGGRTG